MAKTPQSRLQSTPQTPAPQSRRTLLIALAAAALVIGLGIVAVVATKSDSDSASVEEITATSVEMGTVTSTGDALPAMPDGGASDPAVGKTAPTLVGSTFDGSSLSITPGVRPTLVMFVAHWCPHCQREVPQVVKWLAAGAADGVDLRVVSTGTDAKLPNYPPSAWLAGEGLDVPTMVDSEMTDGATAYGLTSFPFFVAVDAKGTVTKRMSGELSEEQFTSLVAGAKG